MPTKDNLEAFQKLVTELLTAAHSHPEEKVRQLCVKSVCAFAMLKADARGPNTLDGPDVTKIVENAVRLCQPAGAGGTKA